MKKIILLLFLLYFSTSYCCAYDKIGQTKEQIIQYLNSLKISHLSPFVVPGDKTFEQTTILAFTEFSKGELQLSFIFNKHNYCTMSFSSFKNVSSDILNQFITTYDKKFILQKKTDKYCEWKAIRNDGRIIRIKMGIENVNNFEITNENF